MLSKMKISLLYTLVVLYATEVSAETVDGKSFTITMEDVSTACAGVFD